MNREPVVVNPAVLAWALGFGVFLAFAGAAAVAPPNPRTQLAVAAPLLLIVVPVVYLVLDADDVANHEERSWVPLPYLVIVTLTSVLAAALVPVPTAGVTAITARGLVFLVPFGLVSWLAIRIGSTGDYATAITK
ncbi:hypothetical protein ACFR9U_12150 [Halorientalis brevis]|uniref:Uncharacterized protein n=1 Tax=Halorientalis brevis TaxID=1126241 RepID=A0ABD6CE98_9EURY|nr:hypothetical protein [Halorientalis brevis]